MKLDEAKELLKKEMQQTLYVIEKCSLESQSGKEQWKKEAQAIETVLQELERLQNENEELERRNNLLECCKYINADCLVVDKIKEAESARWQDKIKEKIEEQTKRIDKLLEDVVDKSIGCINVSYLSKKEKEEVIAKRNSLVVQKATLQQVKDELLKGEREFV